MTHLKQAFVFCLAILLFALVSLQARAQTDSASIVKQAADMGREINAQLQSIDTCFRNIVADGVQLDSLLRDRHALKKELHRRFNKERKRLLGLLSNPSIFRDQILFDSLPKSFPEFRIVVGELARKAHDLPDEPQSVPTLLMVMEGDGARLRVALMRYNQAVASYNEFVVKNKTALSSATVTSFLTFSGFPNPPAPRYK